MVDDNESKDPKELDGARTGGAQADPRSPDHPPTPSNPGNARSRGRQQPNREQPLDRDESWNHHG